ncbi:hypothetical protein LJR143_001867 [Pseudoxanthomonas sp. LjRoot143]|uniref:Mor transcription activator family protein n=1 Tax=Pseudoxanthomonas sp. LjRoot143 TaxID=3342266 RepID=UPI003ECEF0D7
MSDESWWATAPERFTLAQAYHLVAEVIGWDAAVNFGMKVWDAKRPPSSTATSSVHGGGRGVIFIPKTINVFFGRNLVDMVGTENALKLAAAFGGERLEFPCIARASIRGRNRAIAQRIAEGARTRTVAVEFDLTEQHIRRIAKATSIRKVA